MSARAAVVGIGSSIANGRRSPSCHSRPHGSGVNSSGRLDGGNESAVASGAGRGLRDKEAHGPASGGRSCASEDDAGVNHGAAWLESYRESGLIPCGDQAEPAPGSSRDRLRGPELARDMARETDAGGGEFGGRGLDAIREAGQTEAGGAHRARGAGGPDCSVDAGPRAGAAGDDDDGGYSDDSFALDGDNVVRERTAHDEGEFGNGSAGGVGGTVLGGHGVEFDQGCAAVDAIPSLLVETGRGAD